MVTASAFPHLTIATIHEFRTADGRLVTVRLTDVDVRAIAQALASRALRNNRTKATALAGSIKATVHIAETAQ